jgi:ABC-type bacteriocin/lantibiotic exporter with double-glycine peptidase domain
MKNAKPANTFIKLSINTFRLLSPTQRTGALKNIIYSIIQASLEVISLTAIIPLFYQLVNFSKLDSNTTLLKHISTLTGSLSWYTVLALIVLLFILKNLAGLWLINRQFQFINQLYITFSEKFYHRFYRQAWSHYLHENSAETFRKIKNTPYDFTNHVLQSYLQLVTDLFICTMMIGLISWIDYRSVYILLGLSVPIFIFYYFFRKNIILKIDRSFREVTPKANISLAQGIDSFAEAKIYQKENFFIQNFIRLIKITSGHLANLQAFANLPSRILETLGIICFASVILYGKFFSMYEDKMLFLLGLLLLAMYRIIPSINRALTSLSQIQAYAYSVSELNEVPINTLIKPTETNTLSFESNIEFKNISFHYTNLSDNPLLKNLNFSINKGDFVILEGPSGVGKTTLIHLLAGLIPEYTGEFIIDDIVLSSALLQAWQCKLGLVPQATIVLQDTLLKNIAFGEDENLIDISQAEKAAKLAGIHEFIVGLPLQLKTPVGENGLTLSGGQRQRLILARALYRNPEILLLDEVTNQLDEENKMKILNTLKGLTQNGKTIILASHDVLVKQFATRIFRLERNKIIEIPPKQSLVN